jgi:hypothetical protein
MSTAVAITVKAPRKGGLPLARVPYAALVRVRPERGRMTEHLLSFEQAAVVEVEPGVVDIDAVLASGHSVTQTVSVALDQSVPVPIFMPDSPHEGMGWLSLTTAFEPPSTLESFTDFSLRSRPLTHRVDLSLHAFDPLPANRADVQLIQAAPLTAQITGEQEYQEARVLYLRDSQPVGALTSGKRSRLACLSLAEPGLGLRQVCALPGPFEPHERVQVAIRQRSGDALWHLEIVPEHPELATVLGFLQRGDQRALALMREHMELAVRMMRGKSEAPIAAAIGLALLLRIGQLEQVQGWSRNLWQWFPAFPDGAALHAAVLLRELNEGTDEQAWKAELRGAVLGAARCGLPLLTDSLRRLRDAAGVLHDIEPQSEDAAAAVAWTDRLLRAADPDAVFTTLTLRDSPDAPSIWGMES